MPELRTRPRRGFERQDVSFEETRSPLADIEVTPRQKGLALGGTVLAILLFVIFSVDFVVKELNTTPPETTPPQATKRQTPRATHRSGHRNSTAPVTSQGHRTVLDATKLAKVRAALNEVKELLPRLAQSATSSESFKPRMSVFRRLLEALPEGDRRALFPMITAEAIQQLFNDNPGRACQLLDKLFRRVKILLK